MRFSLTGTNKTLTDTFEIIRKCLLEREFLTWSFLASVAGFYFLTSALFATRLYELSVVGVFTSALLATLLALAPVAIYKRVFLRPLRRPRKFLVVAVIAVAFGIAREQLLFALNLLFFKTALPLTWMTDLMAGIVMLYFVVIYAVISGTNASYIEGQTKYHSLNNQLFLFRKGEEQFLARQSENIRAKTLSEIAPRLTEIRNLLRRSGTQLPVVELIQDALTKSIRPLGQELHDRSLRFESRETPSDEHPPRLAGLPSQVNPRSVFNPTVSILLFSPLFIAGEVTYRGLSSLPAASFQILTSYLVQLALRFFMPNRQVSLGAAILLVPIVSLISDLLTTAICFPTAFESGIFLSKFVEVVGLGPIWFLAVAYLIQTQRNLDGLLSLSEVVSAKLTAEKSLLEQKIWIARRNWSYLIHGTIQSTITAVLVRASREALTDPLKAELDEGLERALRLLNNPPKPDADLQQELANLRLTWSGVAQLTFDICDEALELLEHNAELRFATNEIIKEGVSNAIRHGGSNEVETRIKTSGEAIHIRITNHSAHSIAENPASLGSKMMDELTSSWSLTRDEKTGIVCLAADLVIDKELV